MPSISSAGTAGAAEARVQLGKASAAALAAAPCRKVRRSATASPSSMRSNSDSFPIVLLRPNKFSCDSFIKPLLASGVSFISLLRRLGQPKPQDFRGLRLHFAKPHPHPQKRLRVDDSRGSFEGVRFRKNAQVDERSVRQRVDRIHVTPVK